MKKILLIVMIPFLSFAQNLYDINNYKTDNEITMIGCVDLDETLIDLVAVFGDTSLLNGLLGCSELIPTLESVLLKLLDH